MARMVRRWSRVLSSDQVSLMLLHLVLALEGGKPSVWCEMHLCTCAC